MNLPPYPKYKDSGVEWIGEVPEGWGVHKLKFVISDEKNSIKTGPFGSQLTIDEMHDNEIKVYNQKNVIKRDETLGENFVSSKKFKELISFKTGPSDLLITTRGTIGRTLRLSRNADVGILHPCLMKLITDDTMIFRRYIEILIGETNLVKMQLQLLSCATTIDVIYQDNLKEVKLIVPPLPTQHAIASYLDTRTARIDDLISKNQGLIDLLKEKRTALINHAVTKGMDPDARMKDSGVEWIGEVPEGWEVRKVKFLVSKINSGVTPTGGAQIYVDDGIPLLRSQNIHFDGLRLDDVAFIPENIHHEMSNSKVIKNDVLLNITGASIGRCTFFDCNYNEANVNQHVCILRTNKIHHKFLTYYLMSKFGQDQIFSNEMGTSREGLNYKQIGNFTIIYPVIPTQTAIASFLDKETARIDREIKLVERKIELLEEYRKSLIHHVVTGKVDVRGMVDTGVDGNGRDADSDDAGGVAA